MGSWLTPSLCMLRGPSGVTVIDGDTLEPENLDRQLYTLKDVGKSKARALAKKYRCGFHHGWFSELKFKLDGDDWLFCCADNVAARRAVLFECDRAGVMAVIAANEITSAEAYFYYYRFMGTAKDPRMFYREAYDRDDGNDPRAASIGCTGVIQQSNRQLVSANFMAAALAQHLYVLWGMEAKGWEQSVAHGLPHHFRANLGRLENVDHAQEQIDRERTAV